MHLSTSRTASSTPTRLTAGAPWLPAAGQQRSVGDTDRRQVQHSPEVQREPSTPWMVEPRGVHQQDVGAHRQPFHALRQRGAFAQREPSRVVRRPGDRWNRDVVEHGEPGHGQHDRTNPAEVPRVARTLLAPREGEEAAGNHQPTDRDGPRQRLQQRNPALLGVQRTGITGPRRTHPLQATLAGLPAPGGGW